MFDDRPTQPAKMLLERLRHVSKLSVGRAAQHDHLAAQFLEQPRPQHGTGSVIAIEHDPEPAGSDRLDIDNAQHGLAMRHTGIGDRFGRRRGIAAIACGFGFHRFDQRDQPRPLFGIKHATGLIERFQTIPSGRVVAGGDLQTRCGAEVANQQATGGRRGDSGIKNPATLGRQSAKDRVPDHQTARAPVATDHNRSAIDQPTQRAGKQRKISGIETVSDDATQARDTEDPRGHLGPVSLPWRPSSGRASVPPPSWP